MFFNCGDEQYVNNTGSHVTPLSGAKSGRTRLRRDLITELSHVDVHSIVRTTANEIYCNLKGCNVRGEKRLECMFYCVYEAGIQLGADHFLLLQHVAAKCNISRSEAECIVKTYMPKNPSKCKGLINTEMYLKGIMKYMHLDKTLEDNIISKYNLVDRDHKINEIKDCKNVAHSIIYYGCICNMFIIDMGDYCSQFSVNSDKITEYAEISMSIFNSGS